MGGEPAGFFIQSENPGPALFIAVDPATLTPAPVPGDNVNFTILSMGTAYSLRQATAIGDFSRIDTGHSIDGMIQNVTRAADVVTNVGEYESELLALSGTIAGNLEAAGIGHSAAQISTIDVTGTSDLKLRMPASLADTLEMEIGCTFTLQDAPMWRHTITAQPSIWLPADVTVTSCPAPQEQRLDRRSPEREQRRMQCHCQRQ